MIHNNQPDQAHEDLLEAWFKLQDAHLILEAEAPSSRMYEECIDAAKDATRKYYRVLERMEKARKEDRGRDEVSNG